MQIKAIRMHAHGGPEVLRWEEVELVEPGPGSVRVRHHAVGLNYIDVYHRTGQYPTPSLPCTIGMEAAGVVEALGDGVGTLAVGDRVAYATPPLGAYAEARNLAADRLVRLPDCISFETGAAMMLQGMTVEYLLRRTYPLQAGQTVLFHAAAGGVGLIFCQWARQIGATVIGTVGSAQKADLARAHGCTHTILYREENVVERVRELTGGKGVDVVYDGVGKDTFEMSLDCLRPRGLMVSFGNASGSPAPLDLQALTARGSLYITRPTLATYIATTEELRQSATDLFDRMLAGVVQVEIGQRYTLADIRQAHQDIETRKTIGSTVILP